MDLEQTTEVALSGHAQKLGTLAIQLGYEGALTLGAIEDEIRSLIAACQRCPARVVLVTNEVGMGIVPENRLARHFRDIAGRVNQRLAAAADEVWLVVSGIGVKIK